MSAQRIGPVLMFVGLLACGGSSSKPGASSSSLLAAALAAGVHFDDGQVEKGSLPSPDPSLARVTLGPNDSAIPIAPALVSIMSIDVTNPDQDAHPVAATLMQFSDADSYVKVPGSKVAPASKASGQNDLLQFMDGYRVDDDLCKTLCNKVYSTQLEVTMMLNGRACRHQKYDVRVDCSVKGDPKNCSASDSKDRDSDAGAGTGKDAGAIQTGDAGAKAGMDAGIAMDAARGGADAAEASVDAGSQAGAGSGAGGAGSGTGGDTGGELDAGVDDAAIGPTCDPKPTGSRVIMQFDPINANRVTSVQWIDSTSTMTANLVANNAGTGCPGGNEHFGQAYGAPEGSQIVGGIGAGQKASLVQCGLEATVTLDPTDCSGAAQLAITTKYTRYADARANEVRIERTWPFDANTAVNGGTGLRPYVPRVPYGTFTTVIYPNQAGTAVTSASVSSCGGDCITATGASWNGSWIADIAPSSGLAMIILRDPAMTSSVDFTINNDGNSGSNLSSFVIVQPSGGWKAPLTEVEYLCFEDLTSWPQTQRDAAQLPAGCGP